MNPTSSPTTGATSTTGPQSPSTRAIARALAALPRPLRGLASAARLEARPSHRLPHPVLYVLASAVAVAASLGCDRGIVALATAHWPHLRDYPHFQFADYARLTVPGVLVACAGWPVVVRVSAAPRALFAFLAVVVTIVLFAPDLYLRATGQSTRAVLVLMSMHVAIAIVTYAALVVLAPPRPDRSGPDRAGPGSRGGPSPGALAG